MIHVAWRILTHEIGRSLLAVGGMIVAVLMIFLQLGFYSAIPAGGTLVYDRMLFDIVLTSSQYVFQGQAPAIPRRRLYQALGHRDVEAVAPLYMGAVNWINEGGVGRYELFVIGFRLEDRIFDAPSLTRQLDILRREDTVLIDSATYPMFGKIEAGRVTEMSNRTITIGGTYDLGIGFLGLGVALASDQNFLRLQPERSLSSPSLGLLRLKPGADPDRVASDLRAIMPADTRVFTRREFLDFETEYWVVRTSTGQVFGFGVVVALIVGGVILYQTLSTQVSRQLPQYATLKAMGYTNEYLRGIVVSLALMMSAAALPLAYVAALFAYGFVHDATKLPIAMNALRLFVVVALRLVMSTGAAIYAARALKRADPVDLF
ncbi:MAG: FtsX-like permease family protein [Alphaproteobacteria bacterium]|nr:FtsX-like permease family protein [Alphaproteobacteria bacterium]